MNLDLLRAGHRIRTRSGREAEVLDVRGEATIHVAYLDEAGGPFGVSKRTGEEAQLGGEDVETLIGSVTPSTWERELTVVLHYAPESEEGPAEYRAETLSGAPNDVKVQGGDPRSARRALDHLLGGLWLMGFRGAVGVEDATSEGFERYEVEVSDNL